MKNLDTEILYSATKSSGSGGQHVNKVNTKVELRFSVRSSVILTSSEKKRIVDILKNRITREGELIMTCDATRNQLKNKDIVRKRFYELISASLKPEKKRIPTKPGKKAKENRIKAKKITSQKKVNRQKPDIS